MSFEPPGKSLFIGFARGNTKHRIHYFHLFGDDTETIQTQKDVHHLKRSSLVPVEERVIASDPHAVGCSEQEKVNGLLVMPAVRRSVQRRIQQARIADTVSSAVVAGLIRVDGYRNGT